MFGDDDYIEREPVLVYGYTVESGCFETNVFNFVYFEDPDQEKALAEAKQYEKTWDGKVVDGLEYEAWIVDRYSYYK